MSTFKKIKVTKNMDYLSCRKKCIEIALQEGHAGAAEIYMSLPIPSTHEWAECLQEVVDEPTESTQNPHHVIGRWELRLFKKGAPTVLQMEALKFGDCN